MLDASPKRRARNPPLDASTNSGMSSPADRTASSSASTGAASAGSASTIAATNMSPLKPPTRSRWIASAEGVGSAAASADDGYDIGSLGHHGEVAVARSYDRGGERILDGVDRVHTGQ